MPQQPPPQREWLRNEATGLYNIAGPSRQNLLDPLLPVLFLGSRDFRQLTKSLRCFRVELVLQKGQQDLPYAIASMFQVEIACVFSPGLLQLFQIFP